MFEELLMIITTRVAAWWREIAAAVFVFVFFLLLRRFFTRYIFKVILKLTRKYGSELDAGFLAVFEAPLRTLFVVLGVYFALMILPLTPLQNMLVLRFLRASYIILIAWALYSLAGILLFEEITKKLGLEIDRILIPFFSKLVKFVIIALALSIIAQEWGYEISGLIAGLGLGGLAVALAAKDALSNIFGGVVIITDKPFTIGDWIATPSVEGTVEDITFRSTKIRGFAHALITVPNAKLADEPITNWTRMGKRRVSFHLGVSYTTPVAKLKKCVQQIRELLENHPGVHKETIFVRFDRFGESSLDIFIYFFTITTKWGEFLEIKEEINFKTMEILQEEGVTIALPSRSLYLEPPLQMGPSLQHTDKTNQEPGDRSKESE
ncbi:MAG: mechanosensitive ion channel family protein [Bacillota bacterium]